MRNETLMIFERDQPILFRSFRRSLNIFFNHLRQLSSKSLRDEIKSSVEELFRQMLHLSLQPSTSPRTSQCLWQYQPFGRIPHLLIEQLEMTLSKLVQLNDLFKLSLELVRTISRVSNHHCQPRQRIERTREEKENTEFDSHLCIRIIH